MLILLPRHQPDTRVSILNKLHSEERVCRLATIFLSFPLPQQRYMTDYIPNFSLYPININSPRMNISKLLLSKKLQNPKTRLCIRRPQCPSNRYVKRIVCRLTLRLLI